ncbi:hypothetical protein [Virgibacillus necropolis]|uniref:Uncharacterized protein n=1 Tax=Virgibacillus necropolis TaxID=163877 RepID=A0A221M893_9BACI|nr:hypothetical protein [Virgibacillus necropolis]ASN03852.1 hypothetical protein CFK40_01965 [Virgibacillus necropolis]
MHKDEELIKVLNELDPYNPFDTFNQFYDKTHDIKAMQSILNEIKKYNVYDFVARVSALNLLPENQNKSILFDALITSILTIKRTEYTSTNKMSNGKFRKIINQIDNMNLKMGQDPAENVFVENVMFYGNYLIFPGINYLPGYCLQMIIETLFLRTNNFDMQFLKTVSQLIQLVLSLSNRVATELDYNLASVKKIEEVNIAIPEKKKLEHIAGLVTVDNDYIKCLVGDDLIMEEMYSDFGQEDIETALKVEEQKFFVKPFLKGDNNETIILNISVLSSFVFHKIILLADKYGYKEELIDAYNASVWKDCRRSLEVLGHKKIKEKEWGINLLKRNNYKEALLNVCNNQIMLVTCICDDGKDYSKETIFDMYPSDQFSELLERRISYFHKKLSEQKVKNEDIFHIIIFNSYGRGINASFNKKLFYHPLALNPYELKCISINEKPDEAFLPRYIRAKNSLRSGPSELLSELNNIEIYVHNHYSFYINDDFNPKKNTLFVAPGDSVDYIIRAVKKENKHLVESYKDSFFSEVVLNDKARKIYADTIFDVPRASLLVEFSNVNIWVYSPQMKEFEELNLYFSIVDALSYWLAECSEILERYTFAFDTIKLQIKLTGSIDEYYYKAEQNSNLMDLISFKTKENNVTLNFTPESFRNLSCKDNSMERQMMELILVLIGNLTIEGEIEKKQLETIFETPFKKKFFTLEYINSPYLKPMFDRNFRKIKAGDESELLDDIGSEILTSGKWSYGIIKNEQRSLIARYVVDYLYKLLQTSISKLRSDYLVELVVNDLEKVMYNLMLVQKRYAYDVACYPEKKEEILNDFNELNKTSRALKFLAEYVAACPPDGTEILGELQYDKLLAICSLIIDWAYKNDLFYYNIFNTPVEILNSDRVGMKQDEFNKLQIINSEVQERQLNNTSTDNIREKLPREEFPNIEEELNSAFLDEYSFSFNDFCNTIFGMISYGDENKREVNKAEKCKLANRLIKSNTNLNIDKVEKVIQYISLTKRGNYLKPGRPYRSEDVYPWRFNRELSFTRRPVIIREDELIWGNRQLFHMLMFTLDLIYDGKLKSRGKKLTKLIGKISNKRGDDFNNQVYNKIYEISDLIVDKNLEKINHKKIVDDKGNTLGDIDVLYIIPERKRIVLAEVKDFNFSKSPYEMDLEYQKMFVDKDNKKCFATKHKRRTSWVKEHIEDIKEHYRLTGDGWTAKEIFIVNKAIISNAFYNAGATIITYGEITKARLERV